VKVRRIKRSGSALAVFFVCLLGGCALTLASESLPGRLIFSAGSGRGSLDWIALSYPQQICLGFAAGDVPPNPDKAIVPRIVHPTPTASEPGSMRPRLFAPKLARHMLDSILLI
jgi:hypothetical protein